MSKPVFKKLLKEKATLAAFNYLIVEKSKQSKIVDIKYEKLEMQEYLLCGDRNVNVSRSQTLDIKSQKKWKYVDKLCSGCHTNEESREEMLSCKSFGANKENISYK